VHALHILVFNTRILIRNVGLKYFLSYHNPELKFNTGGEKGYNCFYEKNEARSEDGWNPVWSDNVYMNKCPVP
jgi:hypothetical protein